MLFSPIVCQVKKEGGETQKLLENMLNNKFQIISPNRGLELSRREHCSGRRREGGGNHLPLRLSNKRFFECYHWEIVGLFPPWSHLSLVAFLLHRMLPGMLLLSFMSLPWIWGAQVCQCHCTCLPGHTKKVLRGPRKQNWQLPHSSPPRHRLRGKRSTNNLLNQMGSQESWAAFLLGFQTPASACSGWGWGESNNLKHPKRWILVLGMAKLKLLQWPVRSLWLLGTKILEMGDMEGPWRGMFRVATGRIK